MSVSIPNSEIHQNMHNFSELKKENTPISVLRPSGNPLLNFLFVSALSNFIKDITHVRKDPPSTRKITNKAVFHIETATIFNKECHSFCKQLCFFTEKTRWPPSQIWTWSNSKQCRFHSRPIFSLINPSIKCDMMK